MVYRDFLDKNLEDFTFGELTAIEFALDLLKWYGVKELKSGIDRVLTKKWKEIEIEEERRQLIRLRHMRDFMDKWEQSLTEKLAEAQKNEEDIKKQRLELLESLKNDTDNKYYNIIDTIFQLLEKQTEQMTLFIGKELEKVKHLKENTRGKDDRSMPN